MVLIEETQVGVEALMVAVEAVVLTHLTEAVILALALVEAVQLLSYHNA